MESGRGEVRFAPGLRGDARRGRGRAWRCRDDDAVAGASRAFASSLLALCALCAFRPLLSSARLCARLLVVVLLLVVSSFLPARGRGRCGVGPVVVGGFMAMVVAGGGGGGAGASLAFRLILE